MICPNCGTALNDNASFCTECGTKLTAAVPQAVLNDAPGTSAVAASGPETSKVQDTTAPTKVTTPKKQQRKATLKPVKKSAVLAVCLVVLVVIGVLVFTMIRAFSGSFSKNKGYALYVKDEEIWYTDFSSEPWQVTSQLFAGDMDLEHVSADVILNLCTVTKDGSAVYFPDRIKDDLDTMTLYMRSLSKKQKEAVKVAGNVVEYEVAEDNSSVLYRNDQDDLYRYNVKKESSERLSKDIKRFQASADQKSIAYLDDESTLYLLLGKEKIKMSSDVFFFALLKDGQTVIYNVPQEAGTFTLYKKTAQADKTKIADHANFVQYYETGEVYYSIQTTEEGKVVDLFEDDVPSDTAYDDFRAWAKERSFQLNTVSYYFYDGEKSVEVFKNYAFSGVWTTSSGVSGPTQTPVLYMTVMKDPHGRKLSTLDPEALSSENLSGLIEAMGTESFPVLMAVGSSLISSEDTGIIKAIVYEEGIYVLKYVDQEDRNTPSLRVEADLYRLDPVSMEETLLAEGICSSYVTSLAGKVYYLKDYDPEAGVGDLYVDESLIQEEVSGETFYGYATGNHENHAGFLFVTDYGYEGTTPLWSLWDYNGKDAKHVGDDIGKVVSDDAGGVLYLTDMSSKRHEGDLYRYEKGASILVDEEVQGIKRFYFSRVDLRSYKNSIANP